MITTNTTVQVGKYLVSPLSTALHGGDYLASVSIRSGQGSNTYDRVMRFTPRFATRDAAVRYAAEHGVAWAHQPAAYLRG
jgi:hypothetical protein